jgi:hypothetical protein
MERIPWRQRFRLSVSSIFCRVGPREVVDFTLKHSVKGIIQMLRGCFLPMKVRV